LKVVTWLIEEGFGAGEEASLYTTRRVLTRELSFTLYI
jgi:hypothetical protein